jgi:nucleoside-diphosphate-sugar epimerase
MKILILGSTGFVGRNLYEDLSSNFQVYGTYRGTVESKQRAIHFDLHDKHSWKNVVVLNPDVIINASGYGVVKSEQHLETMYGVNYLAPAAFFDYIQEYLKARFIQIGTAFEYDLSFGRLTETTPCRPKTHYGISKLMMSQYIINRAFSNVTIVRPFGMFGPYENESKLFPQLIIAQREKLTAPLTDGNQVRDYFFVKDLSTFIEKIIIREALPKIINVGSNQEYKVRTLATLLGECIPEFQEKYWGWGGIKPRANESDLFINASELARSFGLDVTTYKTAFRQTINYYFHGNHSTAEV